MESELKLIREQCTGCGICADLCPSEAIEMTREMAYPEFIPDLCILCLTCVEECPFEAIELEEISTNEGLS